MENGYKHTKAVFFFFVHRGSKLGLGFFLCAKKKLIRLSFQLPLFIVLLMGVIVF